MTLSKRDARLRMEALRGIGGAVARLSAHLGSPLGQDAFKAALHDHPRAALRRIALAKKHLRKAERALRAWIKR